MLCLSTSLEGHVAILAPASCPQPLIPWSSGRRGKWLAKLTCSTCSLRGWLGQRKLAYRLVVTFGALPTVQHHRVWSDFVEIPTVCLRFRCDEGAQLTGLVWRRCFFHCLHFVKNKLTARTCQRREYRAYTMCWFRVGARHARFVSYRIMILLPRLVLSLVIFSCTFFVDFCLFLFFSIFSGSVSVYVLLSGLRAPSGAVSDVSAGGRVRGGGRRAWRC